MTRKILIIGISGIIILSVFSIFINNRSPKAKVEIGKTPEGGAVEIVYDLEYSFKNFTNQSLSNKNLNGKTIYASSFLQEKPDSHIFKENMQGVTFVNCNLDNVYIPPGNTIIGGSQRRFKVQNDLRDWIIDEEDNPIEVMGKEYWESEGYSTDPRDIPKEPLKNLEELKKIKN